MSEDLLPSAKLFAVLAIEKVAGGRIHHYFLRETKYTIFKLIEAIIHSRLQKAMTTAGALNPNHYDIRRHHPTPQRKRYTRTITTARLHMIASLSGGQKLSTSTTESSPNLIRFMLNIVSKKNCGIRDYPRPSKAKAVF
jgi:hypothetical protein